MKAFAVTVILCLCATSLGEVSVEDGVNDLSDRLRSRLGVGELLQFESRAINNYGSTGREIPEIQWTPMAANVDVRIGESRIHQFDVPNGNKIIGTVTRVKIFSKEPWAHNTRVIFLVPTGWQYANVRPFSPNVTGIYQPLPDGSQRAGLQIDNTPRYTWSAPDPTNGNRPQQILMPSTAGYVVADIFMYRKSDQDLWERK